MCGISVEPLTYVNLFGKSNSVALAGAAHRGRFNNCGLATTDLATEIGGKGRDKGEEGRGRVKPKASFTWFAYRFGLGLGLGLGSGLGSGSSSGSGSDLT